MTDLTLRAYIKEIDSLVEQSNLDEAIAHCRYILQTYSKHLETYRLLGKAYLEAKRYGDASDIFQRVLSAVPDDFVSHIGMAIVREDEGNLDSAIWHMERAFETNPANPAIQQELKRLIGRRDNVEPHKVRLTRGALARMYAQGELYPQAIAELRGALQEDPDRPDLQVLLARMFWKTDQWAEAADVCNRVLEKLPYCREANKIMASILQANNKIDEASAYHRRLAALDPYAAYVEKATIDPQTVEAKSVTLMQLDWQPGQPLPSSDIGSNTWADSLGIEIDSSSPPLQPKPETPSWVEGMRSAATSDDQPASEPASPPPPTEGGASGADGRSIPQWMQDAGWQPSTGEAVEGPVSFSDRELASLERGELPADEGSHSEVEGDLAPAEIPSWLQDIAPSEQSAKGAEMSAKPMEGSDSEKLPDWLSDIAADADDVTPEPFPAGADDLLPFQASEAAQTPAEPQSEPESYGEPDTASAVPTWLEESTPGATDTIVGWLGDRPRRRVEDTTDEEPLPNWVQSQPAPTQADEEIPTWIGEAQSSDQAETPTPVTGEETGAPDWLSGIAEDSGAPASAGEAEAAPDWLQGIAEEPAQAAPESEAPQWLQEPEQAAPAQSMEEGAPDWLSSIGEGEEVITPVEDIPGWLAEEAAEAGIDTRGIPPDQEWMDAQPEAEVQIPEIEEESAPGLIQEMESVDEMPPAPQLAPDEIPEFAAEADQLSAQAEELADPPPPWLKEETIEDNITTQEIYPIPAELKQQAIEATQAEEPTISEQVDDDEVFRWLEGLAARQGADESELTTPEELRPVEPPAGIAAESQLIDEESQAIPDEPEQGLDWLEQLAAERGLDVEAQPSADMSQAEPASEAAESEEEFKPESPTPTAPDWLREMQADSAAPTTEREQPPAAPPPVQPAAEVEALEMEVEAELEGEAEMETEAPAWLQEMAEDSEQFEEAFEAFSEVADQIRTDSVESEEPAPPIPEPESELDWLSSPPESAAEPSTDGEISATDWLNQLADDTDETITAPQVMMQAESEEVTDQAEVTTPEIHEEPVAEPPQTPDLVEEISAEADVLWTEEDDQEAPPVIEEKSAEPVASQTGSPLETANLGLKHGDVEAAVAIYDGLISQGRDLEGIIANLNETLADDPNQPLLWQTLGDAYMNNDQLNEAIKAYQKGTEVA